MAYGTGSYAAGSALTRLSEMLANIGQRRREDKYLADEKAERERERAEDRRRYDQQMASQDRLFNAQQEQNRWTRNQADISRAERQAEALPFDSEVTPWFNSQPEHVREALGGMFDTRQEWSREDQVGWDTPAYQSMYRQPTETYQKQQKLGRSVFDATGSGAAAEGVPLGMPLDAYGRFGMMYDDEGKPTYQFIQPGQEGNFENPKLLDLEMKKLLQEIETGRAQGRYYDAQANAEGLGGLGGDWTSSQLSTAHRNAVNDELEMIKAIYGVSTDVDPGLPVDENTRMTMTHIQQRVMPLLRQLAEVRLNYGMNPSQRADIEADLSDRLLLQQRLWQSTQTEDDQWDVAVQQADAAFDNWVDGQDFSQPITEASMHQFMADPRAGLYAQLFQSGAMTQADVLFLQAYLRNRFRLLRESLTGGGL